MARVTNEQRLDPRVLEERTQAIGHELFALARREHAHLSVLNRWTSQVLSWCLTDPAVKGAVLRFIDVLPSLQTPHEIARHVREYFPTAALHVPTALRIGSQLARPGLLTRGALSSMVTQLVEQVARQFIAQAHPEGVETVMQRLAERGATCSLDVLGEQVLSDPEADAYVAQCRVLLERMSDVYARWPASTPSVTCGPRANLSVKPSALTPRFDPISPRQSLERAAARLRPLLQCARERGAMVTLDMEQDELRDLTLELAKALLAPSQGHAAAPIGIVIQAYLLDAEAVVDALLAWLTQRRLALNVRLVKGAYWDAEVAQAIHQHWPSPVYQQKAATDLAFERLTRRLLSAFPAVTTAIASHNVRSIAHAMAVAELLGLPAHQMEFQLLYGMGDAIHAAIVERGYPVRIYTPIGELIPGMAYLVRRILENTANESFLRQDVFDQRSADELLKVPALSAEAPAASSRLPAPSWTQEPFRDVSKAAERARMARALETVTATFGKAYPLLVGDRAVEHPEPLMIRNPARPSELLGMVTRADAADVDRAVEMARVAQPRWARFTVEARVACLRQAAQLMREQRDALAAWAVFEVGKTWREADAELVEAIDYLEYYSQQMRALALGQPLLQLPGERNEYRYQPRGVAAVIAPWNFPAAILTGMTAAALVSGNAVILKPAEQSSIIAARIARMLREAGVPAGVLQFLPGLGEEVGAALAAHPGVHTMLFTGSKTVGLSLIRAAAQVAPGQRFIKHVIAEMGGKNAIVIDADADLDAAVAGTLRSAFGYAGQKCSAASRVIIHHRVYERFVARLAAATDRLVIGDPADPGTDVGPLIDAQAQQRLLEAIGRAGHIGTLAYRYPASRVPAEGHFVGPAIATGVPPDDPLAREELFGPLLCVFRAETFEDAITLACDSEYALTGGVYSRSPSHLEQAVRAFEAGNLYLNRPITGARVGRQPFGGYRLSGLGTKAGGPEYLLQLMIPKTICANTTRHGMPLD